MKTNDIIVVGALAFAAFLMLNSRSAPSARTVTVATPGAGTVGGMNPLTSIADYLSRYSSSGSGWNPFGTQYAENSNFLTDLAIGATPDANSASVYPGSMDGGMSVDPNSFTGQWMSW